MERGETFAIADSSMPKAQTLPGWGRDKIRSARDVLIKLGYVERVAEAYGNQRPAQCRLIDQTVGPNPRQAEGEDMTISPWCRIIQHNVTITAPPRGASKGAQAIVIERAMTMLGVIAFADPSPGVRLSVVNNFDGP
jgi:hypothetical protein